MFNNLILFRIDRDKNGILDAKDFTHEDPRLHELLVPLHEMIIQNFDFNGDFSVEPEVNCILILTY